MLQSNSDLRCRLEDSETDGASYWYTGTLQDEEKTIRSDHEDADATTPAVGGINFLEGASGSQFPYERELEVSNVYKRCIPYKCDASFRTSSMRSHAWSVFSSQSLSKVSNISIIALPVWSSDLSNANWYNFGNTMDGQQSRRRESEEPIATELGKVLDVDRMHNFKVISLPLPEQARISRISKRLEDSKDKTEFWMPALPWRCIE